MQNKTTSLHSTFCVKGEFSSNDTRFLSVIIDVMHTGVNLNKSCFDKDVVDSCVDTIKNTPVLGFIKYDGNAGEYDFKGHEYAIKRTADGIEEIYIGHAYGVIPESCNPRWVMKTCDDGEEREFLQVDALLWEKFTDATDIVRRDIEKSESMELEVSSIDGYEDDDGIFHFTNFKFDGACLLGDYVTPAMTGANVRINENVDFAVDDAMRCVYGELNEKIELFNTTFAKFTNGDNGNQGGVDDMTKENCVNENTDFSQTVLEQFQDVAAIVGQYETVEDKWGYTMPRFYLADIQDDEVIVVDAKENYHYYGFSFSINGDKPEIDFANGGKRKKIRYEDYEESSPVIAGVFDLGEHMAEVGEHASEKITEAQTKAAEVEAEYAQVKADYDEMMPKYEEYVKAEAQREIDELNAQKDAKFAEYEDVLGDSEEFITLKENKCEMSVEDINKECAVMFVKASRANKINFSKDNRTQAVVGVLEDFDTGGDGYVHTKYGNIRRI